MGIQRCTGLDALGRRKYGRGKTKNTAESMMKRLLGLGCIFGFVASGMAETPDLRDFSIDTFCPNSNAVRVGEEHCRKYWAKHRAQYAANTRYLAIEAAAV